MGAVAQVRARQGQSPGPRAALAAGTGLVLLGLVAVAFSGGHADLGGALAEKGQDAATASPPAAALLTAEKERVRSEIKSIDKQIETEQAKASKLDKTVAEEDSSIKSVLLTAKKMEEESEKARAHAVEQKQKAARMVKESAELIKESKDAKKKFVQEEAPMENASNLAAHDHSTYRKAELEVAQTVTMLSRKPGDPKLLKKVHKLVKAAETDRANMEKDHLMLSSLERKIASLQVGKATSYSSLRDESVSLKKRAGVVRETVKALKQESEHLADKTNVDITKVQAEIKKPDHFHREAQALRDEYAQQLKHVEALKAKLAKDEERAAKASSPSTAEPTAAPTNLKSAPSSKLSAESVQSAEIQRLKALEKKAAPSTSAAVAAASSSSSPSSEQNLYIKATYDEKAKHTPALNTYTKAMLKNVKPAGLATSKTAEKRKQFLAGLFSAPWNKAGGSDDAAI